MLLTVRDAAQLLETSERQIYRWVDEEEIPFQRVREMIRFNRSELLEWATTRHMRVSLAAFESEDPDDHAPALADAILAGGVHADVPATDREAAIRAVVERTSLPDTIDRELLVELLTIREATSSTAIGDGVAIPHVRHPVVAPGAPATVTICYLAAPIPFGAADGKPVHTIFVIVSPTILAHLQLLAHVARALSDDGFRTALGRHAAVEDLAREAKRIAS
jgi:PTS system nitrogen regulatory IIA component